MIFKLKHASLPVMSSALVLFSSTCNLSVRHDIRVLTYNIRFAGFDDTQYSWNNRREGVINLIKGYDFAGLQEVIPMQINDIKDTCKDEYGIIFRTRETDLEHGEGVPLLYNKKRWNLIDSGTFWLSGLPDEPGSNTWKSACNRVTTFGLFTRTDKNDTVLLVNTHFDHVSQVARMNSIKLVNNYLSDYTKKYPMILFGDLNVLDDNEVYIYISREMKLNDSWIKGGNKPDSTSFTYHGWRSETGLGRIDYIFNSGYFEVISSKVHRDKFNELYPSDHFPVSAVLKKSSK